MFPKEFKNNGVLYTNNIESGIYSLNIIPNSFRLEITYTEHYSNYTYYIKLYDCDSKPLTINNWTFNQMVFHKGWNENFSPRLSVTDPKGIQIKEIQIKEPFSQIEKNNGFFLENRIKETYFFFKYLSHFKCINDFDLINKGYNISNIDKVIRYYLDFLKIKDRLSNEIINQVTYQIGEAFELYLKK